MTPAADLVRQLFDQQLARNPHTRAVYLDDAEFHAAVEMGRITLTAVAEVLDEEGMAEWGVEAVVRDVLNRLLTDRLLAERAAARQAMLGLPE